MYWDKLALKGTYDLEMDAMRSELVLVTRRMRFGAVQTYSHHKYLWYSESSAKI